MKTTQGKKIGNLEIQRFRRILEIQRAETLRSLERLGNETRSVDADSPKDIGDLCETAMSKEGLFRQTSELRRMVRMIDAALVRIEGGLFGACERCGDDINPRRLDALPWTRYCLRCQHGLEQGDELERQSGSPGHITLRKAG